MDMKFGLWNVRSLYGAALLKIGASTLAKQKLGVVALKEARWDKGGSEPADDYTFLYGNGNVNHHSGTGCC
jgi:hypothetical protein